MIRNTARDRVARRLGFRTDTKVLDAIVDEMQQAQEDLERELMLSPPWFLVSEFSQVTCTVDEERVALPSDFLRELEKGTLYVYDTDETDPWIELSKGRYEGLKAYHTESGRPISYSIVGEYFMLHPVPDEAYVLKMKYYQTDTDLSTNVENQWLKYAPGVIMWRAGLAVAEGLRDDRAIMYCKEKYAEAFQGMKATQFDRDASNRNMVREDVDVG